MPKNTEHEIEVCRAGYGVRTTKVSAPSRHEAIAKALGQAGDELFSEHASEYCVPGETTDKGEIILTEPLPLESLQEMQRKSGGASGVVSVEMEQLFGRNLDSFLDYIARLLAGDNALDNVDYTVVGHTARGLCIRVSGDASSCLDGQT